jgi:hypothetical protein
MVLSGRSVNYHGRDDVVGLSINASASASSESAVCGWPSTLGLQLPYSMESGYAFDSPAAADLFRFTLRIIVGVKDVMPVVLVHFRDHR